MKVCFITFGPILFASSRLRCYWPAQYMDDAVIVGIGDPLPDADVYIWQKNAHIQQMKERKDARHWWDVCDPLHWFSPHECKSIIDHVDGIVASNDALGADLERWTGREVHVIPDRLELSHYPLQRQHDDSDPLRFIWYGLGVNRASLMGSWANLARLAANGYKVELTVFDDRPEIEFMPGPEVPIYHKRWRLEEENKVLAMHDIALTPPYPGAWGKVKSNNKKLAAWASGLPTTTAFEYNASFLKMIDYADMRDIVGRSGRDIVKSQYDVRQSAADWEALLCAS